MDRVTRVLKRHWGLKGPVVVWDLQVTAGRKTICLESGAGRYVAKVFEAKNALGLVHPSPAQIDRCLQVFDYLAWREFGHAPRLIRTAAGAAYVMEGGHVMYLMQGIEGTTPPPTPANYHELGRIARILNSYRDFPHPYPIPVDAVLEELRRSDAARELGPLYRDFVDALDVLVEQPEGLIHGEINLVNSLLSHGRLYLVDWDAAGTGPLSLEAGYPLIAHFLSEDLAFDADGARSFYRGYTAGQRLSGDEKELVLLAAILHALRGIRFGDPRRRWRRIVSAVERKDDLLAAISPRA